MKQNLSNQDKNSHVRITKSVLIPAAAVLLAAAAAFLFHLRDSRQNPQQLSSEPDPITESGIVETDLSAAASVQTEISDRISESSRHSVSETVTEAVPVQETVISEPPAEEPVSSSESEAGTVSETISESASESETESVSEEETTSETEKITEMTESGTENSVPAASETIPESVTETMSASAPEKITYYSVLESILRTQSFQNDFFEILNDSDISENEFAIYDVDHDGLEELIIRWPNTASASVSGVVYGYDSEGNIYNKLKTTSYMRFYSNGVIEADTAYRSPIGGDFWGYTLYQYDSESGLYTGIASVEAWSKAVLEDETSGIQETYPEYADVSNSGYVYFISHSDEENTELSDPLDITTYQTWHISYIGGAAEIDLPFQKFTEANISEIK
ncbi:MAG: hypothetical protein IJ642_05735 [Oscillospiraceae bacterium]|nr:hypothetical protein [Oscillospiraceae bacterium]